MKYNNSVNKHYIRIYTILYNNYKLLHCKGNIQIASNQRNIKMEKNQYIKKHYIQINLEFILHYIILTDYYIVMGTFRSEVITAT